MVFNYSEKGFTLVELLVSVGILSLIAFISVPVYQSLIFNLDLSAATRLIASDLRYAQQLAVTTQDNYQVIFTTSSQSYRIKDAVTGTTTKTALINAPVYIVAINNLPNNTVTFIATGAATSTGTIVLSNPNNRTSTIEIKPSGYVKIQ